jgi:hypothetical protein
MANGSIQGGLNAARAIGERAASRIEAQTETVKSLTARVRRITDTNIEHAQQLGFYGASQTPDARVTPVISTLDDAIRELVDAVETLDGSMNLFN